MSPIFISLKRSNLMLGLLCAISIVSIFTLMILPLALYYRLVIVLLIIISALYYILRDALRVLPWSWKSLEVNTAGLLKMTNHRGDQYQATLHASTFVNANLIVMNFKQPRFSLPFSSLPPLVLLATSEQADQLRKLRVWLKWFKHYEEATAVGA